MTGKTSLALQTMEDKENHEQNEYGNKIKHQITIPFLWEEAPGTPKEDWKPKRSCKPVTSHVPLMVKYVASVPFKWEEKPGTPLRTFARDPIKPRTEEVGLENKSLPLPPGYFSRYEDESDEDSSNGDEYDDQDWMSELEFEAMSVQSEESYNSAPYENQVTSLRSPYVEHQSDEYDPFEAPLSPEINESPVNFAPEKHASLKGAAFLAHLFPLYPPKTGFLNQSKSPLEKTKVTERKPTFLEEHKKVNDDGRWVIRRPCTLGELIMQSRRRSYRRKATNMKKYNQQKVGKWQNLEKNKPRGCLDIMASGGGLAKFLRKDFLALKLS